MIRKAKAVWRGTGATAAAKFLQSGVLPDRFEDEKGTNPEELIAAAHAGCFSMTLAFVLQGAAYTPTELTVEAAVTIEPEGEGFRISQSALMLRAQVPIHRVRWANRRIDNYCEDSLSGFELPTIVKP